MPAPGLPCLGRTNIAPGSLCPSLLLHRSCRCESSLGAGSGLLVEISILLVIVNLKPPPSDRELRRIVVFVFFWVLHSCHPSKLYISLIHYTSLPFVVICLSAGSWLVKQTRRHCARFTILVGSTVCKQSFFTPSHCLYCRALVQWPFSYRFGGPPWVLWWRMYSGADSLIVVEIFSLFNPTDI